MSRHRSFSDAVPQGAVKFCQLNTFMLGNLPRPPDTVNGGCNLQFTAYFLSLLALSETWGSESGLPNAKVV